MNRKVVGQVRDSVVGSELQITVSDPKLQKAVKAYPFAREFWKSRHPLSCGVFDNLGCAVSSVDCNSEFSDSESLKVPKLLAYYTLKYRDANLAVQAQALPKMIWLPT
jgi:hypothetical protein